MGSILSAQTVTNAVCADLGKEHVFSITVGEYNEGSCDWSEHTVYIQIPVSSEAPRKELADWVAKIRAEKAAMKANGDEGTTEPVYEEIIAPGIVAQRLSRGRTIYDRRTMPLPAVPGHGNIGGEGSAVRSGGSGKQKKKLSKLDISGPEVSSFIHTTSGSGPGSITPVRAFAALPVQPNLRRADTIVSYGGQGMYSELAKLGFNTFNPSRASSISGGDPTHEELYANVKDISTHGYRTLSREERMSEFFKALSVYDKDDVHQEVYMSKMTPEENKDLLMKAAAVMEKHRSAYDKLFEPWSEEPWIHFLKSWHDKQKEHFEDDPAQPNPWGVDVKSMRYLENLMEVFAGTSASSPTRIVENVCKRAVAFMNGNGLVAEFRRGPLKERSRAFEKVLMKDGRFDWIRDYARNYIVIKKGKFDDMPFVPKSIAQQEEVDMVRAKNRFDPGYDSNQTAGYRDYQIILRTKEGGWLVEVQVIPEESLEQKVKLDGHKDYTVYRSIMEAAKRASDWESPDKAESVSGFNINDKDLVCSSEGLHDKFADVAIVRKESIESVHGFKRGKTVYGFGSEHKETQESVQKESIETVYGFVREESVRGFEAVADASDSDSDGLDC